MRDLYATQAAGLDDAAMSYLSLINRVERNMTAWRADYCSSLVRLQKLVIVDLPRRHPLNRRFIAGPVQS